jgi:hypothetical protein
MTPAVRLWRAPPNQLTICTCGQFDVRLEDLMVVAETGAAG